MKTIISFLSILIVSTFSFGGIAVHSHRGEASLAPQNTVEAIKLAYDLGAQMIETDVSLTKSGLMVVIHANKELKSVWGIDKSVEDLTIEDLKNSKLVHPEKYDAKYANVKIPTLDDILKVIPKDKRFELEIKKYGADFARKVVEAVERAGLTEKNVLVTSFDYRVIKDFKSKYPQFNTLYICSMNTKSGKLRTAEDIIEKAREAGASEVALGQYKKIDKAYVKKIQDAGFQVGVFQVQNLDDLAFAAKLGVNRVCSDFAYKLRENYKIIKALDFK